MATFPMNQTTGTLNVMPGIGDGQGLKSVTKSYDWTVALPAATILTGPLVQAGSVVVDVLVIANGIGTATLNVGDATDVDRFIAAGTGIVQRANVGTARPFLMPTNGTIDVATLTNATSAAGSIDITVFFQPRNT